MTPSTSASHVDPIFRQAGVDVEPPAELASLSGPWLPELEELEHAGGSIRPNERTTMYRTVLI